MGVTANSRSGFATSFPVSLKAPTWLPLRLAHLWNPVHLQNIKMDRPVPVKACFLATGAARAEQRSRRGRANSEPGIPYLFEGG